MRQANCSITKRFFERTVFRFKIINLLLLNAPDPNSQPSHDELQG
jgi:hypothetical protein